MHCRPRIDPGDDGHARPKFAGGRAIGIDQYLDWDALDDLGEISRGIVGRQQSKLRARCRRQTADTPRERTTREAIDFHVDALPDLHMAELGLFVVRDYVSICERHDRQQLHSRLNIAADTDLPVSDGPGNRGTHHGVGEIDLGQREHGLCLIEGGKRAGLLRFKQMHAVVLGGELRLRRSPRSRGLGGIRPGAVEPLNGSGLSRSQLGVAIQIGFGALAVSRA